MLTLKQRVHEAKALLTQEFKEGRVTREYARKRISAMDKTLESIAYVSGIIADQFKTGYHDNRIIENISHVLQANEIHVSHAKEYLKYLNERA